MRLRPRKDRARGSWSVRQGLFLLALGGCLSPGAAAVEAEKPSEPNSTLSSHNDGRDELSEIFLDLGPFDAAASPDAHRSIEFTEVFEVALDQNLDLELARAEEELSRMRWRSTASRLAPELQLGAGVGHTDGRVQGSFGELRDVNFDTTEAGGSMRYRVNLGARILDTFAANREVDAAIYGVLDTRQKLLLRVATLYNELVLSEVGSKIARQRAEDGEQFLNIVSARERSGMGLGSDVARARAELATDRQAVVRSQALWETTSVSLAVVLRLDPEILLVPGEDRLLPLEFLSAGGAPDAASKASARPDVKISRERAAAAAKRFSAAWWDLAGPELDARARGNFLGDHASDLKSGSNVSAIVGWTLSLEKFAKISERQRERTIADLQALRTEELAVGEARQALRQLQAARKALPLAQQGLEAAQQSHRISLAQFQASTVIALEVIDAADRLANARIELASSIVGYNLAQVRVLAATGTLQLELLGGGLTAR